MAARIREISGHESLPLSEGWELTSCAPGAFAAPSDLAAHAGPWHPATVPCTVASALRDAAQWSLDSAPRRFDAEDWWFRTEFTAAAPGAGEELWLCFDGLATVAEVWLNDAPLLEARGMFTAHERRIDALKAGKNSLVIRFRSLDHLLAERRARPRWRAPMVEHQQLRWFRTTLLGRTPGWSPPAAPVGPWRAVRLERRRGVLVTDWRLRAAADGSLEASVRATSVSGAPVNAVTLLLERGGRTLKTELSRKGATAEFNVRTVLKDVVRWWPHTHGEPALYQARLEIRVAGQVTTVAVGATGFRTVTLETAADGFAIRVNGVPVFCRGACWTPLDVARLDASDAALDEAFAQLVDSGMNMVRVGGTMVYESDAFLDRCDAHGVLLWQDLMFANMDYPGTDAAFTAEVTAEVNQLLARAQGRPCLALLCGSSEGEQQAAMWGAPKERWEDQFPSALAAALVQENCPHVPFWPSSAHGGAFPHQASAGSSSYYGVGAYLRPLEDARRAEVRFASECLAFANIPSEEMLARLPGGAALRTHHAVWKTRAPRDLGAGWDFDDVRDHYLQHLLRVDPAALRYADHERYLELGRVITGEVMAATFLEWRRARSVTGGALVWFLRDLWRGAGWGVIDADGGPKAAWHYLRRALAPLAIGLTDEGGNGIAVHLINDRPTPFSGTLEIALFRAGELRVGHAASPVTVAGHAALELNAGSIFDGFHDLSYSYRFGPPPHEIIAASLLDERGRVQARAFHFIGGLPSSREFDVGLGAEGRIQADGRVQLTVHARRFAQSVQVSFPGYRAEDNYFHLAPGESRELVVRPLGSRPTSESIRGVVRAANSETAAKVTLT